MMKMVAWYGDDGDGGSMGRVKVRRLEMEVTGIRSENMEAPDFGVVVVVWRWWLSWSSSRGGGGCGDEMAVNMVVTMVILVWRGWRRLGDVDECEVVVMIGQPWVKVRRLEVEVAGILPEKSSENMEAPDLVFRSSSACFRVSGKTKKSPGMSFYIKLI
nr:hypothetical protein [Tanacetum cinerariifolium]